MDDWRREWEKEEEDTRKDLSSAVMSLRPWRSSILCTWPKFLRKSEPTESRDSSLFRFAHASYSCNVSSGSKRKFIRRSVYMSRHEEHLHSCDLQLLLRKTGRPGSSAALEAPSFNAQQWSPFASLAGSDMSWSGLQGPSPALPSFEDSGTGSRLSRSALQACTAPPFEDSQAISDLIFCEQLPLTWRSDSWTSVILSSAPA